MIYENLKIFLRNIRKYPGLFSANIIGLSVGIIAVMFVFFYSVKELSADSFHDNSKDIYRLLSSNSASSLIDSHTSYPMASTISEACPEIINYTRVLSREYEYTISSEDITLNKQTITYVDKGFFELFSFQLSSGSYLSLFNTPNSIIVSKQYALKLFGQEDPLGKRINVNDHYKDELYTIIGILDDVPDNSTISPDLIVNINQRAKAYADSWSLMGPQLFIQLTPQSQIDALEARISDIVWGKRKAEFARARKINYKLQALSEMYIDSATVDDRLPKGDLNTVRILMMCGLVLLLITSLNYIILNLGFTLRNSSYLKIRSILGASKATIIKHSIYNSLFMSLMSIMLCIALYPIFYKIITSIWNIRYYLFSINDLGIWMTLVALLLTVSVINGLLQYFIASHLLHSKRAVNKQHFMTSLVNVQLIMFIVAVISVVSIHKQLNYMRTSDKGFNTEQTYNLGFTSDKMMALFNNEFRNQPYIKAMAYGECLYQKEYVHDKYKVANSGQEVEAQRLNGGDNYLNTYGITLLEGQDLNKEKNKVGKMYNSSKQIPDVLVNEAFVRSAGLTNAVGTILTRHDGLFKYKIIGVFNDVKNFPFYSSEKPILLGYNLSGRISQFNVSIVEGYEDIFMKAVTEFYTTQGLGEYLEFLIWHYDFEMEYQKEINFKAFFNILTAIILFILLIGIIGLSHHLAQQKTKEIGIRKVNGATISEILLMLNKDFIKWVAIAFVIAVPIAYYAMSKWLENFAYKTELSWWIFALAGVLALGITLLTVSWQSWRAATRNPIESLRYE